MAPPRQALFLLLLSLALLLLSLFPAWNGRLYHPDYVDAPTTWILSGSFGLASTPSDYVVAPLWSPPKPYSSLIRPRLRWPGQRPFHEAHLEISMSRLVARWSFAFLALSAGYLFLVRLWPTAQRDFLVPFLWTTTVMLVLAWCTIGILTVLSMGYAATDNVILGILTGGWILGFAIGMGLRFSRKTP